MASTTLELRGPNGLVRRIQMLAKQEARDARARRGLPFCGLFSAADLATIAGAHAPGLSYGDGSPTSPASFEAPAVAR